MKRGSWHRPSRSFRPDEGKYLNETTLGAESALTAMLAREAAYTGEEMTWDKLLKSEEVYDSGMDINQFA